jgi:putative ABC transport system substrate-binding protein
MATVGDAVETGLIKSLARPDGNITGLSFLFPTVAAKRLEILKESLPRMTRAGLLLNPDNPGHRRPEMLKPFWDTARFLEVEILQLNLTGPDELESVFSSASKERLEGVVILEDGMLNSHIRRIVDLTAKNRMGTIGYQPVAMLGGLLSYAPDHRDMWRRAASYVDKILKGTKPADLPVEQPTKFELVINLNTAKQIGLTIPPTLLARADRVIK